MESRKGAVRAKKAFDFTVAAEKAAYSDISQMPNFWEGGESFAEWKGKYVGTMAAAIKKDLRLQIPESRIANALEALVGQIINVQAKGLVEEKVAAKILAKPKSADELNTLDLSGYERKDGLVDAFFKEIGVLGREDAEGQRKSIYFVAAKIALNEIDYMGRGKFGAK